MEGWIGLFVVIWICYLLFRPKKSTTIETTTTKVAKMTAFDAFLIEEHEKSKREAAAMPTVVPNINITMPQPPKVEDDVPLRDDMWIDDLYLGMIVSEKYDTDGLRKEAMEAMDVNETELDELVEQYKLDNKKKK